MKSAVSHTSLLDLFWFVLLAFAHPEVKSSSIYVSFQALKKLNRHYIQSFVSVAAWEHGCVHVVSWPQTGKNTSQASVGVLVKVKRAVTMPNRVESHVNRATDQNWPELTYFDTDVFSGGAETFRRSETICCKLVQHLSIPTERKRERNR